MADDGGREGPLAAWPRGAAMAWRRSTWSCPAAARPGRSSGRRLNDTKFYPDASDTADALLRNADGHVPTGQWAEAIEIYQRVIQQFGDKVATSRTTPGGEPSEDSRLSVDARRECQRRIAALPPEARALYRARVDAQAERWYRQGLRGRDRACCGGWSTRRFAAPGATTRSTCWATSRSRTAGSRRRWRPTASSSPTARATGRAWSTPTRASTWPGSRPRSCSAGPRSARPAGPGRPGGVRRRLSRAAGRSPAARPATGDLAEASGDRLAPPAQPDGRWPTFAGSPTRTRVVPGPIDVGSLQWRVDLEPIEPARSCTPRDRPMGGRPPRGPARPAPRLSPDRRRRPGDRLRRQPDPRL